MDSGKYRTNPRANYGNTLKLAGIMGGGLGKQGRGKSSLDFYKALGLNSNKDSDAEYQNNQDKDATNSDKFDKNSIQLSDINTNSEDVKTKDIRNSFKY